MFNKKPTSSTVAGIAVVIVLLAMTAISVPTTEVFAGKYGKNQALSQADACGNGELPLNVGCQNTGSEIQGDENGVALTAQQTFPAITGGDNGNGNGNGATNPCAQGSVLVTLDVSSELPVLGTNTAGPVTICIVIEGETPLVSLLDGAITVSVESTQISDPSECTDGVVVEAELNGTEILLCVQLNVTVEAGLQADLEGLLGTLSAPQTTMG